MPSRTVNAVRVTKHGPINKDSSFASYIGDANIDSGQIQDFVCVNIAL
jgi:hypothetical protein